MAWKMVHGDVAFSYLIKILFSFLDFGSVQLRF
jgi:hypothetical protein